MWLCSLILMRGISDIVPSVAVIFQIAVFSILILSDYVVPDNLLIIFYLPVSTGHSFLFYIGLTLFFAAYAVFEKNFHHS